MTDNLDFSGDRPLRPDDPDYLGVNALAVRLATILRDKSLKDGFVIGVEGQWGSGKSSLINKTISQLNDSSKTPVIVEFNPWLVGDKRDLIAEFFVSLDEALAKYSARSEIKGKAKLAAQTAKEGLQKYAKHIATGAKLLSAASLVLPQLKTIADILEKVLPDLDDAVTSQPLHEQKAEIEAVLRDFSDPIIVFVDDTERLDPAEVMEILRLLRAVGDLPNIIYVVCYDRRALVRNIGLALRAKNEEEAGEAYLEKIVQATLTIPRPEDFALRRWFLREVFAFSGLSADDPLLPDVASRLKAVIDMEGGKFLSTPRDVVRTSNSLKLVWPAVRDFVDLPDLVWLHLIKLKRPMLYAWVENYMNGFAEVARKTASASDADKQASELLELVKADYEPESINFYRFKEIIPGLTRSNTDDGERKWTSFRIDQSEIDKHTKARRLGSPHYYRYYFALGQNSGFLEAGEIDVALNEIRIRSEDFNKRVERSAENRFSDGELHFSVLFDSLRSSVAELNDSQARFLFDVIADKTDAAIQNSPDPYHNGIRSVWAARAVLKDIVAQSESRRTWLIDFFRKGQSFSFLSFVMRELKNDGRYDLNLEEKFVVELGNVFSERVVEAGDVIFETPTPDLVILVALRCTKEPDQFRARLNKLLEKDENLILLIGSENARGAHISSSGPSRRPLDLDVFTKLTGNDGIVDRISAIIKNRENYSQNIQLAIDTIIAGLEDAKRVKSDNLD